MENKEVEEIIKQISDELKEHCSKFIGSPNNEETIKDIKSELHYIFIEGKLEL